MKRFCITILSTIFLLASLSAQNLSVSSFRPLETDLTANTHGTMETDQNVETAALIKVVTTQTGFVFEAGMMGIVKTVQHPSEGGYWSSSLGTDSYYYACYCGFGSDGISPSDWDFRCVGQSVRPVSSSFQ